MVDWDSMDNIIVGAPQKDHVAMGGVISRVKLHPQAKIKASLEDHSPPTTPTTPGDPC